MKLQHDWNEIKNSKKKCMDFLKWFASECGNHFDDNRHFEMLIFLSQILNDKTPAKKVKDVAGCCWVIARSW